MTLFIATLLMAFILLSKAALLWFKPTLCARFSQWFLRSKAAAIIYFGGAMVWFLWIVMHLGESDFGQYRYWLFFLFIGLGAGSFYFVPDFLSVRGGAILGLLISNLFLNAAYMEAPVSRLFLVTFIYAIILASLYFGTVPYRMRDLMDWMFAKPERSRIIGACSAAYGLVLLISAFTY